MKIFLAIFKCAENSMNHQAWMELEPQIQKERELKGAEALSQWKAKYKNQFAYEGGSLGEETKLIDLQGIHEMPSQLGSFLVVKAESHEEAAQMFLEHPHFAIFPGDAIEVLECTGKSRG